MGKGDTSTPGRGLRMGLYPLPSIFFDFELKMAFWRILGANFIAVKLSVLHA